MLGAIIGDIAGSRFEFSNTSDYNFEIFSDKCSYTDDSICTVAVADAILKKTGYKDSLLHWCRKYPNPMGAYGSSFLRWIFSVDPQPYHSYGNGSAMRVSPVGFAFRNIQDVETQAAMSAAVTHDHPEGIKGAQAVADAIFILRTARSKKEMAEAVRKFYPTFETDHFVRSRFDVTCQGTVPLCLQIFLNSSSFEDAIRQAVSWGGDSDTIAAIVGSMAEAFYGIPDEMSKAALRYLDADMKKVVDEFYEYIKV